MEATGKKVLPENAYRPLAEGEQYVPVVPPDKKIIEVSPRVFALGITLNVIFTFAIVYLALLTGNAIEAAIPIAILAVFLGKTAFKRQNTISENVMIQSIGAGSGVVVAGVVFTLPALYINKLNPQMWHIVLSATMGGFLGILVLIPLRRYFVKEQHGYLPFPEATATTEIIASGETEGASRSGVVLLIATAVGAIYDFLATAVGLWNGSLSSTELFGSYGRSMLKYRFELKMEALAALFGLGYIVGLRYAAVIAAGSVLSFLVLVPLVYYFGQHIDHVVPMAPLPGGKTPLITQMSVYEIFKAYVQPMGIGAIATAGFMGIIKMSRIIFGSFTLGIKAVFSKEHAQAEDRMDEDLSPSLVMLSQGAIVIIMYFFFWLISGSPVTALVGALVTYVFTFLFTPVGAQAIAIVGTNPVSGMTLITLIISSLILLAAGLSGDEGQYLALVIGAAVCTALSTSGGFITDLKIGYWIGVTPKTQQKFKFIGILTAALTVGFAMQLLAQSYGFIKDPMHPNPLAAPQGNLMATIVKSMMTSAGLPYLLYGLGGLIAVMLEMAKVPALAFALGMYLPLEINLGVLAGGFAAWVIGRTGATEAERSARKNQGILIASGLMAGAALVGILIAVLKLQGLGAPIRLISVGFAYVQKAGNWVAHPHEWYSGFTGQILGLVMFLLLGYGAYMLAKFGAGTPSSEARDD